MKPASSAGRVLPVSERTSRNMPAPERANPDRKIRLCTASCGTPSQKSGAAISAGTIIASEKASVPRSG